MKSLVFIPVFLFLTLTASTTDNNTRKPDKTPHINVALLLDTSNSMDGLINQAKSQLWQIVNELSLAKYGGSNPHLRIAIYEYGNDNLPASEGYIRQVTGFTNDLDLISKELFELTTRGGNEFCGQVIDDALRQLDWNTTPDDLNLIFIAGNEPFNQGRTDFRAVARQAKEMNVVVNTIHCGGYEEGVNGYWKEGALLTGGDYSAIDHDRVRVYIVTPYDKPILLLNEQLNDTYIYYGAQGSQKRYLQEAQDVNAMEMDEAIAVERTVSKSKRIYNNASWDLVDAYAEGNLNLKTLDKKKLPKHLQQKSTDEIEAYIKTQMGRRQAINNKIEALNMERTQYLKSNQSDEQQSLETSVLNSIRKQAKAKNFEFK